MLMETLKAMLAHRPFTQVMILIRKVKMLFYK